MVAETTRSCAGLVVGEQSSPTRLMSCSLQLTVVERIALSVVDFRISL